MQPDRAAPPQCKEAPDNDVADKDEMREHSQRDDDLVHHLNGSR